MRWEVECVDELIKNMKANEYVSDGSKPLWACTAPATVREERLALRGSQAVQHHHNPWVLFDNVREAEGIKNFGLCLWHFVSRENKTTHERQESRTSKSEFCKPISSLAFDRHTDCNACAIDPWSRVMPLLQGKTRMTAGSGFADRLGISSWLSDVLGIPVAEWASSDGARNAERCWTWLVRTGAAGTTSKKD